jgi:hypothetical protein
MAYVQQNRAQIEVSKNNVAADFLGSVANALGQAAIQKVTEMIQKHHEIKGNEAFNSLYEDTETQVAQIERDYPPEQWNQKREELYKTQQDKINSLDLPKTVRQDLTLRYSDYYTKVSTESSLRSIDTLTRLEDAVMSNAENSLIHEAVETAAIKQGLQLLDPAKPEVQNMLMKGRNTVESNLDTSPETFITRSLDFSTRY